MRFFLKRQDIVHFNCYYPITVIRPTSIKMSKFLDEIDLDGPLSPFRRCLLFPYIKQADRLPKHDDQLEHGMIGGIIPRKDFFELDLHIDGYKPDDISICVKDNILTISGSTKNEDGIHYEMRYFTRKFILPENVDVDKIKSYLSRKDRISCLHVEAPLNEPESEGKENTNETLTL